MMLKADSKRVGALVTARGGSKGLPGKNVYPLAGKPLIAYTIEAARAAELVGDVYLSSDDAEIIETARLYGCEVPFVRDAALASDEASSVEVVLDAINRLPHHDIWVLLQPTSPLRTCEDIDAVLRPILNGDTASCVTVRASLEHPWLSYTDDGSSALRPMCDIPTGASLRRQDLPRAWIVNGAAYAFTGDWFMRHRQFVSSETRFHVMPFDRSVDIDDLEDMQLAERALGLMNHG